MREEVILDVVASQQGDQKLFCGRHRCRISWWWVFAQYGEWGAPACKLGQRLQSLPVTKYNDVCFKFFVVSSFV